MSNKIAFPLLILVCFSPFQSINFGLPRFGSNSFEQAWKIMIHAIHTCISITGSEGNLIFHHCSLCQTLDPPLFVRGHFKVYSYKEVVHSAKWFQWRRFLRILTNQNPLLALVTILNVRSTGKTYNLKRTI